MKSKKTNVSIILPCYNVENYVEKSIISIKNQTYSNFEVIIVDDGSTDNTAIKIHSVIKDDHRFKYYFKPNGGLSSARNYGINKAKGEYLCFVDSDDWIENDFVEILYNSITYGNNDFSTCNIKRIYDNKITYNDIGKYEVETSMFPAAWIHMFKNSVCKKYKISFYEGKYYEDLDFSTRYFLISENYINTHIYSYNYRQNNTSIMHNYNDKIFDIYDIVENIEKFANQYNVYDKKISNIEFIHIYHILIGTIFRASFHKSFNKEMFMNIIIYVNKKYPKWYKNVYIKGMPIFYKFYLFCLKNKFYNFVFLIVKHFSKYLSL